MGIDALNPSYELKNCFQNSVYFTAAPRPMAITVKAVNNGCPLIISSAAIGRTPNLSAQVAFVFNRFSCVRSKKFANMSSFRSVDLNRP